MAAPKIIEELIDKFDRDQDYYRSIDFNETEVRTQFINPFFDALGWDVYHKSRPDNRVVYLHRVDRTFLNLMAGQKW